MRALEVLRVLSDREISKIDALVKAQKRKSLQHIYAALKKYRKRSGIPTHDELYVAAFEKEYSSDKNYLLRNELRLLNELLYEYLIQDTFSEYIKKHRSTYYYWLARSFFDRKLNAPFEADIDRFVDYGKDYIKPEDTSKLLDLYSLWLIYTKPKTAENLQEQMRKTDEWKAEQIRHLRYKLREVEARHAYVQSVLTNIEGKVKDRPEDGRTEGQNIINLAEGQGYDPFEEYLILKKHAYQTKGLTRIEVLKKMLAIEEGSSYHGEYSPFNAQITSLTSISLEYILMGRFAEADEFMLDCVRRCNENNSSIPPAILQNYIANQINQAQYKRGIDFYKQNEALVQGSRQYIAICLYKAYCHLFLQQADESLQALPVDVQLTEHQNLMFRMIYLIVFIIRGQHDLALNEVRNILRMIKAHEGHFYERYHFICTLFARYINALIKERNARKEEMAALKTEMQADKRVEQYVIVEFSLRWLVEELKQQ
ncbi:MAG: hypothetical protein U0V74_14520 [Chitinophagales bacterium]